MFSSEGKIHFPKKILETEWLWTSQWGMHGASDHKKTACNAGDQGSIPGLDTTERLTHIWFTKLLHVCGCTYFC